MTVNDFCQYKKESRVITMVTSYDSWSATLIEKSGVDCILVGDSAAMVMHGHDSTLPMEIDQMAYHVQAVRRGAKETFIVGDMPFLTHRKGLFHGMECVEKLMKAGANSVKIEGAHSDTLDLIEHIVNSGVPVMGHIGLTPQSVNQLSGYKMQGKGEDQKERLLEEAKKLEQAGCFSLVAECIPRELAQTMAGELTIPLIGIGAGNSVDGQVLVFQDLLGLNIDFKPKFVRTYLEGAQLIGQALNEFAQDCQSRDFPAEQESFK